MTDTEFEMILIALRNGERKTLDGKLAYGYFSPDNVKEAIAKVEQKRKEHDKYWADKIETLPGGVAIVTPDKEEVEKEEPKEDQKEEKLETAKDEEPKEEVTETTTSSIPEIETEPLMDHESLCHINTYEDELLGWNFSLIDCDNFEGNIYDCFMQCGTHPPLVPSDEPDLCYETTRGFIDYEAVINCAPVPSPAPDQVECIDMCLEPLSNLYIG